MRQTFALFLFIAQFGCGSQHAVQIESLPIESSENGEFDPVLDPKEDPAKRTLPDGPIEPEASQCQSPPFKEVTGPNNFEPSFIFRQGEVRSFCRVYSAEDLENATALRAQAVSDDSCITDHWITIKIVAPNGDEVSNNSQQPGTSLPAPREPGPYHVFLEAKELPDRCSRWMVLFTKIIPGSR